MAWCSATAKAFHKSLRQLSHPRVSARQHTRLSSRPAVSVLLVFARRAEADPRGQRALAVSCGEDVEKAEWLGSCSAHPPAQVYRITIEHYAASTVLIFPKNWPAQETCTCLQTIHTSSTATQTARAESRISGSARRWPGPMYSAAACDELATWDGAQEVSANMRCVTHS